MICVPLINKNDNTLIGILEVVNKNNETTFSKEDEELLFTICSKLAGALTISEEGLIKKCLHIFNNVFGTYLITFLAHIQQYVLQIYIEKIFFSGYYLFFGLYLFIWRVFNIIIYFFKSCSNFVLRF